MGVPSGWKTRKDADGRTYYWNKRTRQTSYDHPDELPKGWLLPKPWYQEVDDAGRPYYVHEETLETSWQRPGLIVEIVSAPAKEEADVEAEAAAVEQAASAILSGAMDGYSEGGVAGAAQEAGWSAATNAAENAGVSTSSSSAARTGVAALMVGQSVGEAIDAAGVNLVENAGATSRRQVVQQTGTAASAVVADVGAVGLGAAVGNLSLGVVGSVMDGLGPVGGVAKAVGGHAVGVAYQMATRKSFETDTPDGSFWGLHHRSIEVLEDGMSFKRTPGYMMDTMIIGKEPIKEGCTVAIEFRAHVEDGDVMHLGVTPWAEAEPHARDEASGMRSGPALSLMLMNHFKAIAHAHEPYWAGMYQSKKGVAHLTADHDFVVRPPKPLTKLEAFTGYQSPVDYADKGSPCSTMALLTMLVDMPNRRLRFWVSGHESNACEYSFADLFGPSCTEVAPFVRTGKRCPKGYPYNALVSHVCLKRDVTTATFLSSLEHWGIERTDGSFVVQIRKHPKHPGGLHLGPSIDLGANSLAPISRGVSVKAVAPYSACDVAGLRPHDVLLMINDVPVATEADAAPVLRSTDIWTLEVLRSPKTAEAAAAAIPSVNVKISYQTEDNPKSMPKGGGCCVLQ